ncbi:MAG: 2-hydroxyacyl-CoA dehydratase family protein [Firmicutes bacterium]|nr:2-hydroxyacyl-CoA dehydratase family protein [Bacillota bacterium]
MYLKGKRYRSHREWRGVVDTLYDYSRWLYNWFNMFRIVLSKPRNIKAMFRYRWMSSYLAVPMMVDRHTQGLRGEHLRICHAEQDIIIEDDAKLLDKLFRGDRRIGNAIAFIEEHTGEKWDWTHYFECAKRVNYATKCRLEWLEMSKTPYPQVFGSNLALYTETNYMAISGRLPVFEETDRKIMKLAEKAFKKKKMAANEYRHRAIVWGVQSHYYMDFLVWLLNCWGIVPLTDMLSMDNTDMIAEVDTPENREQAIYDIAKLTERMIMRNRTHGGYKVLLDDLWKFVEEFNADMVILWEHMSCKALDGMHGLFEQRARELGINLVWVSHDLFDPRVVSRQGVRDQINTYMRTVMGEEPVDPTLEILPDEESW